MQKSLAVDAENASRFIVILCDLQNALYMSTLYFLEGKDLMSMGISNFFRKMMDPDQAVPGKQNRAFDDIFQFADISRPVVHLQSSIRIKG
jgi:hypothetical protein